MSRGRLPPSSRPARQPARAVQRMRAYPHTRCGSCCCTDLWILLSLASALCLGLIALVGLVPNAPLAASTPLPRRSPDVLATKKKGDDAKQALGERLWHEKEADESAPLLIHGDKGEQAVACEGGVVREGGGDGDGGASECSEAGGVIILTLLMVSMAVAVFQIAVVFIGGGSASVSRATARRLISYSHVQA